jgi:rubrerythrin
MAVTDEAKKRAEAIQRADECQERAAQYDALADDARQRGDIELSTRFASSAHQERLEARRIEEDIGKFGE